MPDQTVPADPTTTAAGVAMPFQPVAAEQAEFLLRELDWGEQFVGTAMNPTMGNTPIYIYSLVEANKFFGAGNTNLGTLSGSSRVGISWVEPPEFISWVRDSLKDTELAKAIEQALADAPGPSGQADADGATNAAVSPILPYLRQANIIAELVQIRLYQLKEALGSAE